MICQKCFVNIPEGSEACPKCGEGQPINLPHLNFIENPRYAGKKVIVEAVVASTSISYLVPKTVHISYTDEERRENSARKEISLQSPLNMQLVGINEATKFTRLIRFLVPPSGAEINGYRELEYRTVYRIRVRPPVFSLEKRGEKIVDEHGYEYKSFDIYIVAEEPINFQPSSLVKLEGLPLPAPKTQQTTLLGYKIEFPEEADNFCMEKLEVLKKRFSNLTIVERLNWILENFEIFSNIVGRRNLATAGFLAYFTPLWVKLGNEIQRGWGNILFCGDTTTAKTETVRKMISLLKGGMLVTAETASTVGLTGTATQVERQGWFIDWGFLVLLDRKLLAIDGVHKLSLSNWAALAEAERSGVVSIVKAAKNSAYARTRQIKIANPVDRETGKYTTKTLNSFLYPCQAIATVLDKVSIARLDLAVFSGQNDVLPEEINRNMARDYDPLLENMSEALKWCWSGKAQIIFSDEALEKIFSEATNLYNTFFYEEIPLVTIDMKWKLARLSAALAYLTLSTEDYKTVKVEAEHVALVADFIRQEYTKAGLNILAQTERHETLAFDDAKILLEKLFKNLSDALEPEKLCEILKFIVIKGRVTKDEVRTKFNLTDHNQTRPLFAVLQAENLIKAGKGFYPEPKLIQVYKLTDGFNLPWLPSLPGSEKEVPNAKNSDNNFGKAQDFNQNFDKNFSPSTPSYSDHVNRGNHGKICQSCIYWKADSCLKHPEWATVTPSHPACELYQPKEGDTNG